MRRWILFPLLIGFITARSQAETSTLWGQSGEGWDPAGRLPDFSRAGYRSGQSLPEWPVKANVKEYGAVGDGVADDTEAFLRAINTLSEGVLLVPSGRYKLTQAIKLEKSHFVIRGEGPEHTVLFFPKPLSEIVGPAKGNAPSDSWSWSGGVISVQGDNDGMPLASVTAPARRGEHKLTVGTASRLRPGQAIRVWEFDTDGRLGQRLYGDKASSPKEFWKKKIVDFSSRVRSVEGNTVTLDRPLRVEVQPSWNAALYSDEPSVTDVGIENMTIEFPDKRYAGHHDEPGFNAFDFSRVEHSWLRRVTVVNADSGIFLRDGTKFCTLQEIRFTATPGRVRKGYGPSDPGEPQTVEVIGHHGVLITGLSQDNLVKEFRFEDRFIHELGVENAAAGNVFSTGSGRDIAFDHHRRAPYENLFTDIDVGVGTRPWEHGGDESDGPPSGVRETFWNIRSQRGLTLPRWGLETNLIGVIPADEGHTSPANNWVEGIPADRLVPPNLYDSQRTAKQ